MDSKYTGLNYQGLEAFRSLQPLKKFQRGFIPCSSTVQRHCLELEERMKEEGIEPFSTWDEQIQAEVVTFDTEKLLRFLLRYFGLEEIAQEESVVIAVTTDGAVFTKNVGHCTIGIKIVDSRATDPITKKSLFQDNKGYQSVDLCFPIRTILASESRSLFENQFGDIFQFFRKVAAEGLPQSGKYPALKKLTVVAPHDGKAVFIVAGRGGGAKVIPYFCPYCTCNSNQLCSPCPISCDECVAQGKLCRHWPVEDAETVESYKLRLHESTSKYSLQIDFERDLERLSALTHETTPDMHLDNMHINYDYNHDGVGDDDIRGFFVTIAAHIQLRKKYGQLNHVVIDRAARRDISRCKAVLDEVVPVLKETLQKERETQHLQTIISKHEQNDDLCLLQIESLIIDSMHLSNRCIEKLLRMLLIKGISSTTLSKDEFKKEVETIVNDGSFCASSSTLLESMFRIKWTFPQPTSQGQSVGDVSLCFKRSKQYLKSMHLLFPICLPDINDPSRDDFVKCISLFQKIVDILEQKELFSDEEIDDLQDQIDEFGKLWIQEFGDEGLGNYLHYLIAGHVTYYLRRYGNLYYYCQQGWEQLNWRLKTFYFRRTNRGGKGSKGRCLLPIYRFLCRRLGWMTGIGDTYFSKKGTKEDEPAEEMYEAIAEATVETEDVDDDLDDDDEDMDKST
jgi:hypothetical protein